MKLGLILMVSLLACGCAANPALQSQVNHLQEESAHQNAEIRDLSAKAARCNGERVAGDLKDDAYAGASAAWDWLKATAVDAGVSEEAIRACYSKDSDKVHSLSDAKALLSKCMHQR